MLKEILEKVKSCKILDYKKIKKQVIKDLIDEYDFEVNYIDSSKKFDKVKNSNKEIITKLRMTFPKYGLIKVDDKYIVLNDECYSMISDKIDKDNKNKSKDEERPIYTLTHPTSLAAFIKKYILKTKDNVKVSKDLTKIYINNKEMYKLELPECAEVGTKNIKKTVNPFNKDEDILFSADYVECYKDIIKSLEKLK